MRLYSEALLDADEKHKKYLHEFNQAQTDWFTICQVCGRKREGTLAQLREPCGHGHPAS